MKRTTPKNKFSSLGSGFKIESYVSFKDPQKIAIGNDVELRRGCRLYVIDNSMDENKFNLDIAIELSDGVHLKENVSLSTYGGYIKLGINSNIGQNCVLYGQGGIDIGKDVFIGPNTSIVSGCHQFEDTNIPISRQGTRNRGIVIDDDVWIGMNVAILDGVHIGRGCVIGAGSVVTKDIPEFCVAYGNPARVHRKRGDKLK